MRTAKTLKWMLAALALCLAMPAAAIDDINGSGTETDPYQIATVDDWMALATYMATEAQSLQGEYVKIMNDIDFTGMAFTALAYDGVTPFAGTLLGNNKTFTGITNAAKGVIYILDAAGTVRDLTVQGSALNSGLTWTDNGTIVNCVNKMNCSPGGFAYQAGGTARFENCTNEGRVDNLGSNIGGFVGTAEDGVTFLNCVNKGNVTGNGNNVGGFVGNGKGATYTNCINQGHIDGGSAWGRFAAGFQGNAEGTAAAPAVLTFKNCVNEAQVTFFNCGAGFVANANAYVAIMADSCRNSGYLHSFEDEIYDDWDFFVAGFFNVLPSGSVITNCYNAGKVSDSGAWNFAYTGGGIFAKTIGVTESNPVIVRNCYNAGQVSITFSGGTAGGIAGQLDAYVTLDNCYNVGTVIGSGTAGALAGRTAANAALLNCYNAGEVKRGSTALANVVGNAASGLNIENCCYVTDFATPADGTVGTATTLAELAASTDLAGTWEYGDAYTLPLIVGLADEDAAKAYAAIPVPTTGETLAHVTRNFHVGAPAGVTWTSSSEVVAINGNNATVSAEEETAVTLTATCGNYSRAWALTVDKGEGVVGDANEDGEVNVNDVTTIINYILGKNPSPFNFDNANVNGDEEVNVMDVTIIINMILGAN